MDWKDVGKFIAKGAPMLGNIVGNFVPGASAVGQLAGGAASMVCSALGVDMSDPEAPDKIAQALQADPEALLKLKQIEADNEQHLREMNFKVMELQAQERKDVLEDRQNARHREIEIRKAGGTNMPMYGLAGLIVVGFFVLCFGMIKWKLPDGSSEVVFMLFGTLATSFGAVVQYFFGSSQSSGQKTKLMAQAEADKKKSDFNPMELIKLIRGGGS